MLIEIRRVVLSTVALSCACSANIGSLSDEGSIDAAAGGGSPVSAGGSTASSGAPSIGGLPGSGGVSVEGGASGSGGTAGAGGSRAGSGGDSSETDASAHPDGGFDNATDPELLVAFIGDQGNNGNSDAVLNLIREEGAVATVHNGDFDYADNPDAWNERIDRILGPDYPYFAIVGNHDAAAWNGSAGYQSHIEARHARVPEMNCTGDLGVQATCLFRGLHLVESCVGTGELSGHGDCGRDSAEQVEFIRAALADQSIWSVCNWHKNQNDMQVGTKSNEVGWAAYVECMSAGAIVATGHEHSYARTLALTDVGNAAAAHGATGAFDLLELFPGSNFVFVSGLGGVGIRDHSSTQHSDDTWWASYYAADGWMKNGVAQSEVGTYGALFIRFHVDGDPRRARAYFKDVDGRLVDEFSIVSSR